METPVLKWMRYGVWTAHLHVEGKQACKTRHGNFSLSPRPIQSHEPTEVTELTQHGVPFGKACAICLRVWQRHKNPKKAASATKPQPPPGSRPLPLLSSRAEKALQLAQEIELLEQRLEQRKLQFKRLLEDHD